MPAYLTIVVLVAPAARLQADESEDGTIEVMTAAWEEVLALGDLCGWNLNLTTAQEKVIRAKVATARGATFGHLSADGQLRVRADVCKDEQRTRLKGILAGISFD